MPNVFDLLTNPEYKRQGPNTWTGPGPGGIFGTFTVETDGVAKFSPIQSLVQDMLLQNKPMPATPHKAPAPLGKMPPGGVGPNDPGAADRSPINPDQLKARVGGSGGGSGQVLLDEADKKKQKVVAEQVQNSPKAEPDFTLADGSPVEDEGSDADNSDGVIPTEHPFGLSKKEEDLLNANKPLLMMAAAPRPDVGPLLSLIDTWTGSKLGEGYKSPGTLGDQAVRLGKGYADVLSAITDRDYKKASIDIKEDEQYNKLMEMARLESMGYFPKGYTYHAAQKALTKKYGAEADFISAKTDTIDALRDGLVRLNDSKAGLNDANSLRVRAETVRLMAATDKLRSDIYNNRLTAREIEARTAKLNEEARRLGVHIEFEQTHGQRMPTTPKPKDPAALKDAGAAYLNETAKGNIAVFSKILGKNKIRPTGELESMLKSGLRSRYNAIKNSDPNLTHEDINSIIKEELNDMQDPALFPRYRQAWGLGK